MYGYVLTCLICLCSVKISKSCFKSANSELSILLKFLRFLKFFSKTSKTGRGRKLQLQPAPPLSLPSQKQQASYHVDNFSRFVNTLSGPTGGALNGRRRHD